MKGSRLLWYVGTVFTTLAMLAASTTAVAQQQARTIQVRSTVESSRVER